MTHCFGNKIRIKTMTRNFILTCSLFFVAAFGSGCNRQPTIPEAEFGEAVNNVMQSQINDYEAAIHPNPNATEGSDAYRLDAALDAHRSDVAVPAEVQRPLTLNLGGTQR
jgi:hypothetical protein